MFKSHTGLFDSVAITRDLKMGVEKWSINKDAPEVECIKCKKMVPQKGFMDHIQRIHPTCLTPLFNQQQQKNDEVANVPPIVMQMLDAGHNKANVHDNTDQTMTEAPDTNELFAVQQSSVSKKVPILWS